MAIGSHGNSSGARKALAATHGLVNRIGHATPEPGGAQNLALSRVSNTILLSTALSCVRCGAALFAR